VTPSIWPGPERLKSVPWGELAGIREPVLEAAARVLSGTPAERVLDRLLRAHRHWSGDQRRVAAESVFGLGLWRRRLHAWSGPYAEAADLLAALLWNLGGRSADEAEKLAGASPAALSGLGPTTWAEAWSVPTWLAEHTVSELGAGEAEAFWASLVSPAPIYLRANLRLTSRDALRDRLSAAHVDTEPVPEASAALRIHGPRPNILGLEAHRLGHFEVQDLGSQLLGRLVEPRDGERVLDLCAGAGGKTLQLASEAGPSATIDAWDLDQARLARLRVRAQRASAFGVRILGAAPSEPHYDRVLVDAPCSELGTLRRGPDLRWRLTPELLAAHVPTQTGLLEAAARCVRPGGRLVYATCTLHHAENRDVALAFERAHPRFRRELPGDAWLPASYVRDGFFTSLPHLHDTDGFFAAVYSRIA